MLLAALPLAGWAQTAEEALRCLRANVPPQWAALVEVQLRPADKAPELRRMVYATRSSERDASADHWVHMLAPEVLKGVVYLFRQRDPEWERWTYLPAFERVSRVRSEGTSAAALEEIIGLRELDGLMRWREDTAIQLGTPREQSGRTVRPIHATRRVGTGASPRFERMSGVFDVRTCVLLSAEWRDAEGQLRHAAEVEAASLRQLGDYWLPQRIDIRQADGDRARLQLHQSRAVNHLPDGLLDPSRFHKVGIERLGITP